MDLLAATATAICWGLVVLIWIVGAARARSRPPVDRLHGAMPLRATGGAILGSALALTVGRAVVEGLVISSPVVRLLGLVVLVAGTALAIDARVTLGTSWTIGPQVSGDRRLRTDGPYRITRHPIYTGMMGMLVGTAVLGGGGQWLTLIAVGLIVAETKIAAEERLLLAAFPSEYSRYRREVPQLVPGLRGSGSAGNRGPTRGS